MNKSTDITETIILTFNAGGPSIFGAVVPMHEDAIHVTPPHFHLHSHRTKSFFELAKTVNELGNSRLLQKLRAVCFMNFKTDHGRLDIVDTRTKCKKCVTKALAKFLVVDAAHHGALQRRALQGFDRGVKVFRSQVLLLQEDVVVRVDVLAVEPNGETVAMAISQTGREY